METLKQQYANQALIYKLNLKTIKRQLNSKQLADLKKQYNCTEDSQLAKVTMLRGIKL
jgi:hypothetical protein